MTIGREEFLRFLPAAVGSFHLDSAARPRGAPTPGLAAQASRRVLTASGSDGRRAWTIQLALLEPRQLGALAVSRHRVEIVLEGYSDGERDEFMSRFDRAFLRGGG